MTYQYQHNGIILNSTTKLTKIKAFKPGSMAQFLGYSPEKKTLIIDKINKIYKKYKIKVDK